MSLFSWMSPKKPVKAPPPHVPDSSGLRMESTKPVHRHHADHPEGNAQPGNRKAERMARRELLYNVVRESMVKAGMLSSSYKFKVLSLDARGRQFLVMVDLAGTMTETTQRLAEIEALIAQSAKARFDILISAVYWRTNEHVAVGEPAAKPRPIASRPVQHHDLPVSAPAPLDFDALSQPAELQAAPVPRGNPKAGHDPLHPDEVAAFKRALASGVSGSAAMAAAEAAAGTKPKRGPQNYTLLTGFEDTELPETTPATPAALSATQYGELR